MVREIEKNDLEVTHNQQPYAFIENVITDERFRKRGLVTQCLDYAKEIAIKENCYKMMLLTGSKKKSTLFSGYSVVKETLERIFLKNSAQFIGKRLAQIGIE